MNYNFPRNKNIADMIYTFINKDISSDDVLQLDSKANDKDDRFNFIFSRYKKLFLITTKSLNQPKNLKKKDYQSILKYM